MKLQDKVEKLKAQIGSVGGPIAAFEKVGRLQLIVLLRAGLYPDSRVLDIGCGCLRGGYWLIHFLDPGCYYGIEPNQERLQGGIAHLLEEGLVEAKRPRFDHNTDFDASVFDQVFNFYVARSIWTHASKRQIETMLYSFRQHTPKDGVFLTSYCKAGLLRGRDYNGAAGVGDCPPGKPSMVHHRLHWIDRQCRKLGLVVEEQNDKVLNYGMQSWLKIGKQ